MSLKFTVVTAVFNAEDVIEKTIKSVLNQTYTPYEYLIIDGKSSDKTVEIIRKYSKHFEEKNITLKIVSEKDNGIYNAMNKGIDLAEGDFISFLNAGDWYELDALENINKFYEEDSFDLTYGGLHYVNPNGTITNKMSKNDEKGMTANITRVLILAVSFWLFVPHMWYYSIAAICTGLITMTLQYCITKKLLPEIKIKREYFNLKRVLEILKSGIWVSLESLNKMLQTGLDLLVTNLFVNPSAMGLFSIAKQIPVVLAQIPQLVANVFNPELAKLYAENKKEELIEKFKFTINFLSFMMIVPLIGFVVFGKEFYTLWLNGKSVEEINTIQILSILTVLPLLVNAYVEGLYYANTLTNKIKGSVIITTIFSVASIGTEFLLLKATSFNPLIIIAGTSSCFMIVRHAIVTPLYCSHVLNLPKLTFYPALIKSILISCVIYALFEAIRRFAVINSWLTFMLVCACAGIVGYIVVLILLFNKNERKKVIQMIFKRKSR